MKIDIEKIKKEKTIKELLEFSIINIDKPTNPTSFDVSDFVRKTLNDFGVKKTSHFGTLDPKVTGVLPIALNRACKLTGYFLGEDKEYVGIMRTHQEVSLEKIKEAIKEKFLGKIKQTPPKKSRVKREEREREIKSFELLEEHGEDILFRTEVQGGTYIRKLIDDLGKYMNIGMHMLELRRIKAGIFRENDKEYPSVNLYYLEKAVDDYKKGHEEPLRKTLIPAEIISELHPVVEVKEENLGNLFTGKPVLKNYLNKTQKFGKSEVICVFSEKRFIGVYQIINEGEIFARPKFVLQPINNFIK
ncbi:RNA-guided pseudouridylation complex pseudouridine synthase subunit Cbf5 [Candidatus Pacearchaeota archaeon]|nr:RNA-guided pseudouridylation complex pseudouridine synthase subunit Cbf5 [Candidatus Pacearchaeota archaeon]